MALKKNERGCVIGTYEFMTVRQIPEYTGYGKQRRMLTSTIALYAGKKRLINNFKNKEKAIEYAKLIALTYNKGKFSIPDKKDYFKQH